MYEIIDKILLLIFSLGIYLFHLGLSYAVIPFILAVALGCLSIYYDRGRIRLIGNLLYALLCVFIPEYIIYQPLLLYDILNTRYQYAAVIVPLVFLANIGQLPLTYFIFTMILLFTAFLLKQKTDKLTILKQEYNELRDTSSSYSQLMEEKNRSILKNQDYEVNLATLNERNRISKELHDNIGHLLSRSLLQVGALLTISREDTVREGLAALKESLSSGMDDIRNSIHKMYDDSIDLYSQVEQLTKGFTFCPITYEYDIKTAPPLVLKQSLIAIIKEALANIMRHSDATKAGILLREHPAMYQLIILDNGTVEEHRKNIILKAMDNQEAGEGMGLHNISDRVKSFGGNLNISLENGFKIFITIPKNNIG